MYVLRMLPGTRFGEIKHFDVRIDRAVHFPRDISKLNLSQPNVKWNN